MSNCVWQSAAQLATDIADSEPRNSQRPEESDHRFPDICESQADSKSQSLRFCVGMSLGARAYMYITYVVLNCLGKLGLEEGCMVSAAIDAKERVVVVLRKKVCGRSEGRALFKTKYNRGGIEGSLAQETNSPGETRALNVENQPIGVHWPPSAQRQERGAAVILEVPLTHILEFSSSSTCCSPFLFR